MTIIRDEDFTNPLIINTLDCVSADRYLHKVDEAVSIAQVCQDSNNPSLVIVSFSLVGAFLFVPFCKILEVDGDTSYQINDVTAPIAIGHYRNVEIPINTNCATIHPEVVFDFGQVIPNFLSAQVIRFRVGMIGTIPTSFGLNFPSQTPIVDYIWTKGILPRPINLTYSNNTIQVSFEYNGNVDCSCNIQCLVPSGVSHNIAFCPNDIQTINIVQQLSGSPFNMLLTLEDSIGNQSNLSINTVINVIPKPPIITKQARPSRIEISISNQAMDGSILEDSDYQIIKYVGHPSNHVIWKDWSERSWASFIDRDILPNTTYGYAVRYKGKFEDRSNLSEWSVITT